MAEQPTNTNHAAVAALASKYNLRQELVYHLIAKHDISPSLKLATDHAVLKALGSCQRDRNFARLVLARFTKDERRELCEHPGPGDRELLIKRSLAQALENGKILTTRELCAEVYASENKEYHPDQPHDELITLIAKIRRSLNNKNSYQRKLNAGVQTRKVQKRDLSPSSASAWS